MATAAALVNEAYAAAWRPEPRLTVSQWADLHRVVGRPSPEQGPWRTDRVPYMREVMDRLTPGDPCQIVALMKAAQGAGTEGLLNAFGAWYHRYPDAGMLVQPTTKTAKQFVRVRLDPMIEATPALKSIAAPARSRSRSNTVALKEFQGATLAIVGANSGNDLRSYPGRYALMDEVDGYPPDLDGEGDPTELVIQRTAAYRNRKILMLSTPTLELTSIIWKWFQRGDQRHYYVPCPLCGHEQRLIWGADKAKRGIPGGVRWPKGEPHLARYQCEKCGDQFEEWRKIEILQRGQWVASAPEHYTAALPIRSYQINALYYPYGWPGNAWPALASAWESDHKEPIKLKTFVNLKLGEPYSDPAEAKADASTLFARRESYGPEIPARACLLTAGVDVQGDRLEAEIVGWGPDEESWGIEYRVFPGDTSKIKSEAWRNLDAWLASEFLSEMGVSLAVEAVCVDSGYHRATVQEFCGERIGRKVWATLGRAGQLPVWDQKARRTRGKYPPAVILGVDAVKEIIYSSLRVTEPGPRYCHFPQGYELHYFEMLTSEIRVPDYTGPIPRFEWRKKTSGARNESLDARVYAYSAMAKLVQSYGVKLSQKLESLQRLAAAAPKGRTIAEQRAAIKPTRPRAIVADDPYIS